MKFNLIPASEFMMGSKLSAKELAEKFKSFGAKEEQFADEYPRHRVQISKSFYLGTHEVTVLQFKKFVETTDYKTEAEVDVKGGWEYNGSEYMESQKYSWRDASFKQGDNHPVVNVSWNDAMAFCSWLSQKEGVGYRLPTEAEWEYACRAGTKTLYHHGNNVEGLGFVSNVADGSARERFTNFKGIKTKDGSVFTTSVGRYTANSFGLYDMHGNVWEWCNDRYSSDYYTKSPQIDPQGGEEGSNRVIRGNSWYGSPAYCRSAGRGRVPPEGRSNGLGFRVLRSSNE